jgi:hypothetical protein
MSDPQDYAESLDDDELPEELISDKFIEPEDWDAGAGADEAEDGPEEQPLDAEDAAMHVERGIASSDSDE